MGTDSGGPRKGLQWPWNGFASVQVKGPVGSHGSAPLRKHQCADCHLEGPKTAVPATETSPWCQALRLASQQGLRKAWRGEEPSTLSPDHEIRPHAPSQGEQRRFNAKSGVQL